MSFGLDEAHILVLALTLTCSVALASSLAPLGLSFLFFRMGMDTPAVATS